jgi:hypothetical protein
MTKNVTRNAQPATKKKNEGKKSQSRKKVTNSSLN